MDDDDAPQRWEIIRNGLFVTDAELIRRLAVPEHIARECLRVLDKEPKKTGFPQKSAFWGDRRYWPAVKQYLDNTECGTLPGVNQTARSYHHV